MSRTTVATIHLGALRHNLSRIKALAAPAKVMAVVKADAYGHGLERVARALNGEADAFAVAALGDGLRLRAAGHRQRIVALSGPDDASDIAEMQRLQLDAAIHHDAQLQWLAQASSIRGRLRVWLKVDSGMHRLGFAPERVAEVHAQLAAMPGIDPEIGLLTHFSDSEVFGWPDARADWVRTGGLLYGLSVVDGKTGADFGFRPAMTLSTRLIAVNSIKRGEQIGYNGTWTCPEDMPVGVAAVGYGDGYPRSAVAGASVLVGDQRVPLIGRVSMDLITLDLREAPRAKVGDRVTLWGPELPVEIIAAQAGTISYDLTCGMTRRVLFVEDES